MGITQVYYDCQKAKANKLQIQMVNNSPYFPKFLVLVLGINIIYWMAVCSAQSNSLLASSANWRLDSPVFEFFIRVCEALEGKK